MFLPNLLALPEFPASPTDDSIAHFFQLDPGLVGRLESVGPKLSHAQARAPLEIEES